MKDGDKQIPGLEIYKGLPDLQGIYGEQFDRAQSNIAPVVRALFSNSGLQLTPAVEAALGRITQSYGHAYTKKYELDRAERIKEQERKTEETVRLLKKSTTEEERDAVRDMSLTIISATGRIIRENGWNPYAGDWNLAQRVFEQPVIETAAKTGVIINRDSSTMGNFTLDFDDLPDIEDLFSEEPREQNAQYYKRLDAFTFDYAGELGFESFANAPQGQAWSEGTRAGWDVLSRQLATSIIYKAMLPSRISHHPTRPFLAVASPEIRGSGFAIDIAHSRLDIYLKQGQSAA